MATPLIIVFFLIFINILFQIFYCFVDFYPKRKAVKLLLDCTMESLTYLIVWGSRPLYNCDLLLPFLWASENPLSKRMYQRHFREMH